jgi:hypothetical protein
MNVFLHIGYPKCFSTTLQRNYFSTHPDIHYGGIGIESNIDFVNNEVNLLFESGIIYFRNAVYKLHKQKFMDSVERFLAQSPDEKFIAGFSSEHLLFNFTPQGVDYTIKLERLREIFGEKIKLIVVIRDQFKLIQSLYKEYVRLGYFQSYEDFVYWIYKYQDRNFLCELMYGDVIEHLYTLFNKNNVLLLDFETYKPKSILNDSKLFRDISNFLNVSLNHFDSSNYNPSMKNDVIFEIIENNISNRHDLGLDMLEGIENFRRRVFYNEVLNLNLSEDEMFADVIKKRENTSDVVPSTTDNYIFEIKNDFWHGKLEEKFIETNEKINNLRKINL